MLLHEDTVCKYFISLLQGIAKKFTVDKGFWQDFFSRVKRIAHLRIILSNLGEFSPSLILQRVSLRKGDFSGLTGLIDVLFGTYSILIVKEIEDRDLG